MKWSLLVGKFWGAEIRLHISLLLLIPYAFFAFKPESLNGLLRVLALLVGIFACVALHEMGHTLAARLFGIQASSIVLWPLGGYTSLSRRPEKLIAELVISAAGPLANLILFAGLALVTGIERIVEDSQAFPTLSRLLWQSDLFAFLATLAVANLALALFNLAPVYPLDGGQIARGVLKGIFGERHADLVMLVVSLPLALVITGIGLALGDLGVILTGLILLLASATLNQNLANWLSLGVLYLFDRPEYYLKNQDYDRAVSAYTGSIRLHPGRAAAYVSRAIAAMNLLELDQARVDIDQALALDESNATAWTLRGELLALEKDQSGALAAYDRAVQLRPNWSIAYLDRGSRYQDQKDYPRALAEMTRGIDLGRGSPVGYLLRSQLHYQMGDIASAHADADQALHYAPDWMLAFPEIFLTNLEGHLDWALDYYWRAIERMPNAYQVYQGRGDACRVNQRPDWALEDYHRAIKLAPRQGELYLARGRAYQMSGESEKATADFRAAIQLGNRAHIRRQASEALARLIASLSPLPHL